MAVRNHLLLYGEKIDYERLDELEKIRCIKLKALEEKLEKKRRLGEKITLDEINSLMLLDNPNPFIIS